MFQNHVVSYVKKICCDILLKKRSDIGNKSQRSFIGEVQGFFIYMLAV